MKHKSTKPKQGELMPQIDEIGEEELLSVATRRNREEGGGSPPSCPPLHALVCGSKSRQREVRGGSSGVR
jgi:hypothetical protein